MYDVGVIKSDSTIPSSLRNLLRATTAPLENVTEARRDWHPDSNEMVLDLVHPSLFPVVYGRTRILKDTIVGLDDCVKKCGEGETLSVPLPEEARLSHLMGEWRSQDPYSRKFQWLPCEISLKDDNAKYVYFSAIRILMVFKMKQDHFVYQQPAPRSA